MTNVIFCKTDFQIQGGYGSYRDFFRLAELAGYPIIPLSELNPDSDNTYIVTPLNDEWLHGWQNPKARIIHYELEWRWDWRASVNEPPGVAEVWCADKWFAESIGARYIPLGSDEGLFDAIGVEIRQRIYDVSQLSYQTPRRQAITQQLRVRAVNVAPSENLWFRQRSIVLMQSLAMLHVHQHDNAPGIAPLRWCLAAAHHLPMISETVNDRGIFGYTHMVTADYAHLAEFTAHMLKDERLLADYAAALNDLLCHQLTFRKSIEAAL